MYSNSDDLDDEIVAIKSSYNALNNLRIMVIKALITILVDGLPLGEEAKTNFKRGEIGRFGEMLLKML